MPSACPAAPDRKEHSDENISLPMMCGKVATVLAQ
jgi:hypothetical protein